MEMKQVAPLKNLLVVSLNWKCPGKMTGAANYDCKTNGGKKNLCRIK
jgi:hypothetical protein